MLASLSIVAVTNNIFSLISFLTFFPPWSSRRHQEICMSVSTVHNAGTVKITHDTCHWEWHRRQVLFDIYAGMPYVAPLAKHWPPISRSPLVIIANQLGYSKQSLRTLSEVGEISTPPVHTSPIPL